MEKRKVLGVHEGIRLSVLQALLFACSLILVSELRAQTTYYVATNGNDTISRSGSSVDPWLSITYAMGRVQAGDTILVRPGTYHAQAQLKGFFPSANVTVKSEIPYQARLRHTDHVVTFYQSIGVVLEGFDIAHTGPGSAPLVIHVSGFGNGQTHNVSLMNNIIHDSYDNDLLKINHGCHDVLVRGNLFYNQKGTDELIDINSARSVIVEENIFSSAFAQAGRSEVIGHVKSHMVIKDSNGDSDMFLGAHNITVRRNIFVNFEGTDGSNFITVGEDGLDFYEAYEIIIENNLLLGNSPVPMRSAFGIKGVRDVIIRNNTISGNLPALEYGLRINAEGYNPPAQDIRFYNNIWADPTGTMDQFSRVADARDLERHRFAIERNLYWNAGNPIPENSFMLVNASDDPAAIAADPLLLNPEGLVVPYWTGTTFSDGSSRITDVFTRLVKAYGRPGKNSPVEGTALSASAPAMDILGNIRDSSSPDIGAVELDGTEQTVNPNDVGGLCPCN